MIKASATFSSLDEVTGAKRIRHHSAVTYAYDPELVAFVAELGTPAVLDIEAARANTAALLTSMNDQVNTTGIVVEDRTIPDPKGTRCRSGYTGATSPRPQAAAPRCSTSMAAASSRGVTRCRTRSARTSRGVSTS
jgi:hypothetical protein